MIEWTDDPSKFDMHDLWFAEGVKAGRAEAFEEAAKLAESSYGFDIEVWMNSTKREMMAHHGRAIAAAIRDLAKETGK